MEKLDKLLNILIKVIVIAAIIFVIRCYFVQAQNGRYQLIIDSYGENNIYATLYIIDSQAGTVTYSKVNSKFTMDYDEWDLLGPTKDLRKAEEEHFKKPYETTQPKK